ncbi:NAD-dependent epimerase/dehydratase family protein [Marivirga tractuosa]|uniref:NAD-dependent epimerase/dehydratase family protein n=1 Tax=Marivirga tractuosa TaxID=1006 RepID=UPI0035D060BA
MKENNLKGTNILVTGGAGFIGSHLVDKLIQIECNKIIIVDNLATGFEQNLPEFDNQNVIFIKDDISNDSFWENLPYDIDYIFNLAAVVSVPQSMKYPLETYNINTLGFAKVLDFAKNKKVRKVIYASSSAVYGNVDKVPIGEIVDQVPTSPYGHSKLLNEDFAQHYYRFYNVGSVGLRFFNVFGPRQRSDSPYSGVISIFMDKMIHNLPIQIYGDGEQIRDFIYVSDVVEGLIQAAESDLKCQVFNLGTGIPSSINHLFKKLADILAYEGKPISVQEREGDIKRSLADINNVKKLLNFNPKYSLDSGLQALVKPIDY